ncbi:MAG: hypothetical protein ACK5AT_26205, partial [Bradyrhizobium sp.]
MAGTQLGLDRDDGAFDAIPTQVTLARSGMPAQTLPNAQWSSAMAMNDDSTADDQSAAGTQARDAHFLRHSFAVALLHCALGRVCAGMPERARVTCVGMASNAPSSRSRPSCVP